MDEHLIEKQPKQPKQPYINLDCREKALLINLEPEEEEKLMKTLMKETKNQLKIEQNLWKGSENKLMDLEIDLVSKEHLTEQLKL